MSGLLHTGTDRLYDEFAPPARRVYVDTASYGLPPRRTIAALERALAEWQEARADWVADWDPAGDACRHLIAPILGAPDEEIALIPTVSAGAAALAASLGPDDEVVAPEDEFNSLLLPLVVAARACGARVRRVPFTALADSVDGSTTVVATSHVRSNGGGVQDLDAVAEAARRHGALAIVDATHSAGILPVEAERCGLDVVLCAAYKHLLCPRGVAFMRVARRRWEELTPVCAGWRSTADRYASYYGAAYEDLAPSAARFDISLAWHAWVGARASLELLSEVPAGELRAWSVGLADTLAGELDLAPTGSSILGVPVSVSPDDARQALAAAGVAASLPLGQVRVSFHVYNRPSDVARVVETLRPLLLPRASR